MAVRTPVRIVAPALVVPVRVVWDAVVAGRRFPRGTVQRPLGRAVFVWPWEPLWLRRRTGGQDAPQAPAAARETVRQTRAGLRRALSGEPRRPAPAARREPPRRGTRTLDGSRTALTKD